MAKEEQQKYAKIVSRVYTPDDLSEETQTPNLKDDVAAEDRSLADMQEIFQLRNWRVAKSLLVLREQVNEKAPGRNKANDGTIGDAAHSTRDSDHNPWVEDPQDANQGVVTAMDITNDPGGGCDVAQLVKVIHGSRDERVKYIIWNRLIANSSAIGGHASWTWRPYGGENPHTKHVHISVKPIQALFDDTSPWEIFS